MKLALVSLISCIATTAVAAATSCPDEVRYSDGQPLKVDGTFYYPNGQLALRDAAEILYPSGAPLASGGSVFYPEGQLLQSDRGNILYPDGSVLRTWGSGSYDLNYADGSPFKQGESFFYRDGQVAAAAGNLYTEDGRPARPPLILAAPVATYGQIEASIDERGASVNVLLNRLSGTVPDHVPLELGVVALWAERAMRPKLVLVLPVGRGNQAVYVVVSGETITCTKTPLIDGQRAVRLVLGRRVGDA